jgi:hypothetical protein
MGWFCYESFVWLDVGCFSAIMGDQTKLEKRLERRTNPVWVLAIKSLGKQGTSVIHHYKSGDFGV